MQSKTATDSWICAGPTQRKDESPQLALEFATSVLSAIERGHSRAEVPIAQEEKFDTQFGCDDNNDSDDRDSYLSDVDSSVDCASPLPICDTDLPDPKSFYADIPKQTRFESIHGLSDVLIVSPRPSTSSLPSTPSLMSDRSISQENEEDELLELTDATPLLSQSLKRSRSPSLDMSFDDDSEAEYDTALIQALKRGRKRLRVDEYDSVIARRESVHLLPVQAEMSTDLEP